MAPPPAPALPALLSRAASAAAPSPLPPRLTTGNMIKQTQAQTQTPPSRLSASVSRAGSRSGSGGSAGTPASDAAPTPPSPRRHQKALSTSVVAETPRHRRTLSAVDERLTEARDRDPHTALEDVSRNHLRDARVTRSRNKHLSCLDSLLTISSAASGARDAAGCALSWTSSARLLLLVRAILRIWRRMRRCKVCSQSD